MQRLKLPKKRTYRRIPVLGWPAGCLHKAPEQRWDVQRVLEDEWLQDRATATPDAEDLTENAAHVRKMQLQRFRGAVNTVRATVRINAALGAK